MSEDRFDEFIRGAARELYNPPPEPPRELMWQRIRAAAAAPAGDDAGSGDASTEASREAPVLPFAPRSGRRARWWTIRALPLAAMLVLGIALGRLTRVDQARTPAGPIAEGPASSQPAAGGRSGAAGEPAGTVAPTPGALAAGQTPPAAAAAEPTEGASMPGASPRMASAETGRDVPGALPERRPGGAPNSAGPGAAPPSAASRGLYHFAAVQTLNQAEMLLTSFRTDAERQHAIDPQLAAWARDVLSSTRLLLDSPAGGDPRIRPLLEDLELVLAQIVQLRPGGARPEDLELIDSALKQRDVLPRIRTVVPAGPVSAGT